MDNIPYIAMDQIFDLNYIDLEVIQKKILPNLKKKQNSRLFIFGIIVSLIVVKNDEDNSVKQYQAAKFISFKKLASIDIINSIKKLTFLCYTKSKINIKSESPHELKIDFMINKPLRISAKTGLLTATDAKFNSRTHGLLVVFNKSEFKSQIYFPKSFDNKKKWEAIQLEILERSNFKMENLKGAKYFAFKTISYQKPFFNLFSSKTILNNLKDQFVRKFVYSINNPYLKQIPYIQNRNYDYKHNPREPVSNLQYIYHSLEIINHLNDDQKNAILNKIRIIVKEYINKCLLDYQNKYTKNSNYLLSNIIILVSSYPELETNINLLPLIDNLKLILKTKEDKDIDIDLIHILTALISISPINLSLLKPEIKKIHFYLNKNPKVDNLKKKIHFYYHLTCFLLKFIQKIKSNKNLTFMLNELEEIYELIIDQFLSLYHKSLTNKNEIDIICELFCTTIHLYIIQKILNARISKYHISKFKYIILNLFCKLEKMKNEHGFYKNIYNQRGESKVLNTSRIIDSILKYKKIFFIDKSKKKTKKKSKSKS